MKGHNQLGKMPNSPAVYYVTLQSKSQLLSRQREAVQLKAEGEPRSPVQYRVGSSLSSSHFNPALGPGKQGCLSPS